MSLVTITVPTANCQVKFELQGVPQGSTAMGPNNVQAPVLAYMVPINIIPGSPIICEGEVLGNDLITVNDVHGITYYLITVTDVVTQETISQGFYDITGNIVDLDTWPQISAGPTPEQTTPVVLVPAPLTVNDLGLVGWMAVDSDNLYVCIGINMWKKIPLSSF